MDVAQETIDRVIGVYKPNYRYLQAATVSYPKARGTFLIGTTEYAESLEHMTDVEAQLCLNQLCYVFFWHTMYDKSISGVRAVTLDQYLDLRKENMFIVESRKKFLRQTDPKVQFVGEITLTKIKKREELYLASLDFELNGGAAKGQLKLALT